jgi:hypothetical protein
MIYLGTEAVPDVVIAPGRRYAIVKVTNSTMTAHIGHWNWTTEEVQSTSRRSHLGWCWCNFRIMYVFKRFAGFMPPIPLPRFAERWSVSLLALRG